MPSPFAFDECPDPLCRFGALGGAALFGATNLPEVNPTFGDFLDGAAVGVLVGGVAGGVVGYLLGGEKWTSFYRAGVLPP